MQIGSVSPADVVDRRQPLAAEWRGPAPVSPAPGPIPLLTYGTLLCVSDKPLHGEIKLPGQANAFYERAISQHLRIGIETLRILKKAGGTLLSRKLRSFDEPPFR